MIDGESDDDDSEYNDFGDESREAELPPRPACKRPIYEDTPQYPPRGEEDMQRHRQRRTFLLLYSELHSGRRCEPC